MCHRLVIACLAATLWWSPQAAAQALSGANERFANAAVHVYRAEVCGFRSREWAERSRAWLTLLLANVDMEDRRGIPDALVMSRRERDRRVERVQHFIRQAPGLPLACGHQQNARMIHLVESGMESMPMDALARLHESRWGPAGNARPVEGQRATVTAR